MTNKRKEIKVNLEEINIEIDIDMAIEMLQEYKQEYGSTHSSLYLNGEMESYAYSTDERYVLRLVGVRLEYDDEYSDRVEKEKKLVLKYAQEEKAQYEALKKKFED